MHHALLISAREIRGRTVVGCIRCYDFREQRVNITCFQLPCGAVGVETDVVNSVDQLRRLELEGDGQLVTATGVPRLWNIHNDIVLVSCVQFRGSDTNVVVELLDAIGLEQVHIQIRSLDTNHELVGTGWITRKIVDMEGQVHGVGRRWDGEDFGYFGMAHSQASKERRIGRSIVILRSVGPRSTLTVGLVVFDNVLGTLQCTDWSASACSCLGWVRRGCGTETRYGKLEMDFLTNVREGLAISWNT